MYMSSLFSPQLSPSSFFFVSCIQACGYRQMVFLLLFSSFLYRPGFWQESYIFAAVHFILLFHIKVKKPSINLSYLSSLFLSLSFLLYIIKKI